MKPKVKESEKSRILSTKDYSIFEFPDFKIAKKHLQTIKESIQAKNLSKDYPILVEALSYKVIEGKYRFLACYDLQLPIHYKISEVTTQKDAIRIKYIHKNIPIEEVVRVYSDLRPYNDILLMHDEFDGYFPLWFIPYCISGAIDHYQNGMPKVSRKIFDSGELEKWDFMLVRNFLNRVK
jgi:hypothetical protein